MEELIKKDIENLFDQILKNGKTSNINKIWDILRFSKYSNLFDTEYYKYCLIKTISFTDNEGAFIICVKEITYNICSIDSRELGNVMKDVISFALAMNNSEKATVLLNYALQGGAFFERSWLKNNGELLGIDYEGGMLEYNIKNERDYLETLLK